MAPCVNDLQVVHSGIHLGRKYLQRSRHATTRCFHQHPWNYFAVLPPTDCSAWSSSASRLKPINISCLINKWNSLFCLTLRLRTKLLRYLCRIVVWQFWHFVMCLNQILKRAFECSLAFLQWNALLLILVLTLRWLFVFSEYRYWHFQHFSGFFWIKINKVHLDQLFSVPTFFMYRLCVLYDTTSLSKSNP